MKGQAKSFVIGVAAGILLIVFGVGGAVVDRAYGFDFLDKLLPKNLGLRTGGTEHKVLREESVVIDVAEKVSPSVVTVSIETPRRRVLQFNPFGGGISSGYEGGEPRDIGSGFVVSAAGLVITNKHVVSDTTATYKVITSDDKEYEVKQISRDPSNDIAILKIDSNGLVPVDLGSSEELKVGQF